MRAIISIEKFIRWADWGPGKIPVLCAVLYYIGLANQQVSSAFILDVILFIIFAALHSALGYVVNDWGDRELDALHHKPNAFARLSHSQGIMALSGLLIASFLSGLPLAGRPLVLPLWLGWAFFTLAYSLKPFRLKERGVLGLTVSFLAQWSLPILLAFAALGRFGEWDMLVFALAATISGATLEIAHQRWDRVRDFSTHTGTLGSRISVDKLDRWYATSLLLDKIALGAILLTITVNIAPFTLGLWLIWPGWPLLVIYLILFMMAWRETISTKRQQDVLLDPYYSSQRSAAKVLHETLPNLVVPVYLIVLAALYNPFHSLVLIVFLFWRLVLGQADWRWPFQMVKNWWQKEDTPELFHKI